jgi:hypothetical protein
MNAFLEDDGGNDGKLNLEEIQMNITFSKHFYCCLFELPHIEKSPCLRTTVHFLQCVTRMKLTMNSHLKSYGVRKVLCLGCVHSPSLITRS